MRAIRLGLIATLLILSLNIGLVRAQAPEDREEVTANRVTTLQVDPAVYVLWATMHHPKVPKYARTTRYWLAIARCETAHGLNGKNQWKRGYHWKKTTVTGAMGIATSAWLAYGGYEYAPRAAKASKWEQMIIATRIGFIGYQTSEYRTWEDRVNDRPLFREPAGFDQGWGGKCREQYIRSWKKNVKSKP